jgi:ribosomal small subunit protein bTHX
VAGWLRARPWSTFLAYHLHYGDDMGKGDLKSKRGKIHRGTYGNTRLRKKGKLKHQKRQREALGTSAPANPPSA